MLSANFADTINLKRLLNTMKKATDPRHLKRQELLKLLFAYDFQKKPNVQIKAITDNLPQIDNLIKKSAPAWPLEQISKIDLAVLRLSIFELTVEKKEPVKVIIDEAVELAKEFGSDSSRSFINGVLGSIIKINDKP